MAHKLLAILCIALLSYRASASFHYEALYQQTARSAALRTIPGGNVSLTIDNLQSSIFFLDRPGRVAGHYDPSTLAGFINSAAIEGNPVNAEITGSLTIVDHPCASNDSTVSLVLELYTARVHHDDHNNGMTFNASIIPTHDAAECVLDHIDQATLNVDNAVLFVDSNSIWSWIIGIGIVVAGVVIACAISACLAAAAEVDAEVAVLTAEGATMDQATFGNIIARAQNAVRAAEAASGGDTAAPTVEQVADAAVAASGGDSVFAGDIAQEAAAEAGDEGVPEAGSIEKAYWCFNGKDRMLTAKDFLKTLINRQPPPTEEDMSKAFWQFEQTNPGLIPGPGIKSINPHTWEGGSQCLHDTLMALKGYC